jgi:hypothetical protein
MPLNSNTFLEIGQGLAIMIGLPTITRWKNLTRPKTAKRGTFGFNTDTNSLEYWDGKSWFGATLRA